MLCRQPIYINIKQILFRLRKCLFFKQEWSLIWESVVFANHSFADKSCYKTVVVAGKSSSWNFLNILHFVLLTSIDPVEIHISLLVEKKNFKVHPFKWGSKPLTFCYINSISGLWVKKFNWLLSFVFLLSLQKFWFKWRQYPLTTV